MRSLVIQNILACTVLAFAVGGYSWWYSIVAVASAVSAQESQMIAEKSQTEQRAATIATALTKLESSQGMVQGYFVSESNIVDFLTGLEALGPELGSMVRTNSVSPPDTKGEQFISVSITVIGPFDAVLRTLGAIEQASYALSFSSLQLNRAGDEWGAGVTVNVGSMFSSSKVQSATTTTPTAPKKGT